MSIIKADKVEIEIQEQTDPEAANQYMTVVSYQPEGLLSKEIITLLLSDTKPIIKKTVDLGNRIVRKEEAVAAPEAKKDWFVGNNLNDKIYTGSLDEIKDKLEKDQDGSRYYRNTKLTPDGF
jgi:hypothetical protein